LRKLTSVKTPTMAGSPSKTAHGRPLFRSPKVIPKINAFIGKYRAFHQGDRCLKLHY